VFVFATTEPQKIAQAAAPVLSRLQRFDFKRIGPAEIRQRLSHVLEEEHIGAEPDALAAIARAADGSMRDALSLTDQVLAMGEGKVTADRVRDALGLVAEDEYIAILDLVAERRAADVFPAVARLAEAGVDFGVFLTGLADMLRAQLAVVLGGKAIEVSERARDELDRRRDKLAASDLLRMLQVIAELEPRFRKSGQQQLLVETLLVRFALLDRAVDLEDVLRSFGGSSPAPSSPRRDSGGGSSERGGASSAGSFSRSEPRLTSRAENAGPRAESTGPRIEASSPSAARQSSAQPALVEPPRSLESLDLNKVVGKWDVLVERMRSGGKPMLATALEHSSAVAVSGLGVVTIELDEPNDIYAHAITSARADIAAALREWFAGADRVELRRDDARAAAPPKRLTDEMIRAERIAALKKRDPILSAAIDALDLEVAD
jgi:DNA polymerase-3 subunit gamma/tau